MTGALYLNQTGQNQLATYPSVILVLFATFTSESHLNILLDKENAVSIGGSVDELICHHIAGAFGTRAGRRKKHE